MRFFNFSFDNQISTVFLYGVLFFIFIIICLLSPLATELEPIKNHYNILVPSEDASVFTNLIERKKISAITPYNQYVDINSYNNYEKLSISQLQNRLDTRDNRFDPFLKSLVRFFYTKRNNDKGVWTHFYIRSKQSPFVMIMTLNFLLAKEGINSNIKMAGFSFFTILFLFFLIFVPLSIFYFKVKRLRTPIILSFPLFFILIIKGAFFPLWFALLVWGSSFWFSFVEIDIFRKKLRLKIDYRKEDKIKILYALSVVLIPSFIVFLFIQPSFFLFFHFILILAFIAIIFLISFIKLTQVERGPGYTGMLIQPLFRSYSQHKKEIFLSGLLFLWLMAIPLMLFLNDTGEKHHVFFKNSKKYSQEYFLPKANSKETFYPNGYLWIVHKTYQELFLDSVLWDDIVTSFSNKSVSYSPNVAVFSQMGNNRLARIDSNELIPIITFLNPKDSLQKLKKTEMGSWLFSGKKINDFVFTPTFKLKRNLFLFNIIFWVNITTIIGLVLVVFPLEVQYKKKIKFIFSKS